MVRFQSIEESLEKIKDMAVIFDKKAILNGIILVSTGLGAFLAGSLAFFHGDTHPVVLEACSMVFEAPIVAPILQSHPDPVLTGPYIGSRSSRKFHHESCPSAKLIREGNREYFTSKEAALAAGYLQAGNCDR